MDSKPKLSVTVYSDYICPFCYVGDARLARLQDEFDLQADWRGLEIHPDNPPQGRPLSELGYPPALWRQMMDNLDQMAREEGLHFAERTFTTNSHQALLLAEAAKDASAQQFAALHQRLFAAYFVERQNIGQPEVLRAIAVEAGLAEALVQRAWSDARYEERLRQNWRDASRLGISGTPAFIIGEEIISGAAPVAMLREAAWRTQK
ncbi:MAG: DsbA family oxidoreductase [Burkholderiales bacterium]